MDVLAESVCRPIGCLTRVSWLEVLRTPGRSWSDFLRSRGLQSYFHRSGGRPVGVLSRQTLIRRPAMDVQRSPIGLPADSEYWIKLHFVLWLKATWISMIPITWWEDQPGAYSDCFYIEVFQKNPNNWKSYEFLPNPIKYFQLRWLADFSDSSGSFIHLSGSLNFSKFAQSLSDLHQNATRLR